MGVYLNPGATMLRQGRRSRIYVDKSTLVSYLNGVINTERKYVCVSRPRRFGKSMAANMVSAYYDRTVDQEGQHAYLDFLRAWLKDKPYVALCYMTGILPIKKYGTHSALNMFDEFSMVDPGPLVPSMGFTERGG